MSLEWAQPNVLLDLDINGKLPNQTDDPRLGSSRNGSTGGTLSHTSSSSKSSSLEALGSTFVPVLIFVAVCSIIFLTLRRRYPRVYTVRTFLGAETPEGLSPPLPNGWFNWIPTFYRVTDAFILNHCSVDGFFFLRFIKVLCTICFVGCCIVWPFLLPIHATGGNNLTGLDMLTIGNVERMSKLYVHVVVSWIFFGFILYMVNRECIYYINLRQAYFMSPRQAHRLSSRTVLFTCVPQRFLDEHRIRKLFGDTVKDVFIPRNTKVLRDLVEEREKTAVRLEKAEIELVKKANVARNQYLAKHPEAAGTSSALEAPQSPDSLHSKSSHPDSGVGRDGLGSDEPPTPKKKSFLRPRIKVIPRSLTVGSNSGSSSSSDAANDASAANQDRSILSAMAPTTWFNRSAPVPNEDDEKYDDDEYKHPYGLSPDLPDLRGSVANQWLPVEDRPTHRPIANFGRSVDTVRWTRKRLRELNVQIAKLRRRHRSGGGAPVNAVFVEFDDQAAAQAAYQVQAHHQPLHMSPRFIGIRPRDVVWPVMRMRWWERIIRRFSIMGLIAAAVIFWSIPSAFVGIVSNVSFLTEHVFFLRWMDKLPKVIMGVIEGLLPAVALSLWMAAVPIMLRFCARVSGVPSKPMVELFTQSAYFVFQVVQVFLVTTLTSAASAALTDILKDPLSITDVLSQNLPKASNFYLSYILVQCLAGGGTDMVHLFELIRHQVIGRMQDNPRNRWNAWIRLKPVHWGSIFPVFTNLGVIAISYSCIAPLILAFAGLGMAFTYVIYRYNLIYNLDSDLDTKGLVYPRALMHLLVGLYLAEVCMIGLFALQFAFGPLALMAMFTVFTALVHISLNEALGPLMYNLPRSLALEDEDLVGGHMYDAELAAQRQRQEQEAQQQQSDSANGTGGAADDYYNMEEGDAAGTGTATSNNNTNNNAHLDDVYDFDDPDAAILAAAEAEEGDATHGPTTLRGAIGSTPEGARGLASSVGQWARMAVDKKLRAEADESGLSLAIQKLNKWATPDRNKKPNFMTRWLHPEIFEDFCFLREKYFNAPGGAAKVDDGDGDGDGEKTQEEKEAEAKKERDLAEQHFRRRGYYPPEMWLPAPKLWVPRDEARVSRQEVAHSRGVVEATDKGAWLDAKARRVVIADMAGAPYEDPRMYTHLI